MNSAETSGKELERQFGWEQTVRAFRQKSQENFIQISSDYLQSVTKYEAPANAIEQKSTKQKAALSSVQEKCLEHVEPYIVPGRFLFYIVFILFLLFHALHFIHDECLLLFLSAPVILRRFFFVMEAGKSPAPPKTLTRAA